MGKNKSEQQQTIKTRGSLVPCAKAMETSAQFTMNSTASAPSMHQQQEQSVQKVMSDSWKLDSTEDVLHLAMVDQLRKKRNTDIGVAVRLVFW